MKHLELHIIQSVPVACLNRDDLNSPKTAIFGGVQRARVSSQSWKRAIRELAKELAPEEFRGERTRRFIFTLKNRLAQKGIDEACAIAISEHVGTIIETLDSKKDAAGISKIKTLMFFSNAEYEAMANQISLAEDVINSIDSLKSALSNLHDAENADDKKKAKDKILKVFKAIKTFSKARIAKMIKSVQLKDAADIALFGRMVANDHSLTVEAASMFSHALSTHKVDNEIDFFAAVDDLQTKAESGAGITSTLEFNSATYYRFAALNLDMIADSDHLVSMTQEERKKVIRTFIEATIKAIPSARKNTMNSNTLPAYVLGVVREKGHPIQLINAFEKPVRSSQGYVTESIELLKAEYAKFGDTWGIQAVFEKAIPDIGISSFIDEITDHVI